MRPVSMAFLLVALTAVPVLAQVPAGPEFRVNTYTTDAQNDSHPAFDSAGRFIISWWRARPRRRHQRGLCPALRSRRRARGRRVAVNTTSGRRCPALGHGPRGNSLIAWHGPGNPGFDIYAQRFARDGTPRGGEFVVNTFTAAATSTGPTSPRCRAAGSWWPGPGTRRAARTASWRAATTPSESRGRSSRSADPRLALSTNFPSIATGPDGRFVIVWKESVGRILGHRRSAVRRLRQPGGRAVRRGILQLRLPVSPGGHVRRRLVRGGRGKASATAAATESGAGCSRRTERPSAPRSP